jgi:hypothetical protein
MARKMAQREMEQQIAHKQAEMAGAYDGQYDMGEMDEMAEMDDDMGSNEHYNPLRYKQ